MLYSSKYKNEDDDAVTDEFNNTESNLIALDTNIMVRFLVVDDEQQFKQVLALFTSRFIR